MKKKILFLTVFVIIIIIVLILSGYNDKSHYIEDIEAIDKELQANFSFERGKYGKYFLDEGIAGRILPVTLYYEFSILESQKLNEEFILSLEKVDHRFCSKNNEYILEATELDPRVRGLLKVLNNDSNLDWFRNEMGFIDSNEERCVSIYELSGIISKQYADGFVFINDKKIFILSIMQLN